MGADKPIVLRELSKMKKWNHISTIVGLVVLLILTVFYLNGFQSYPIKGSQLETALHNQSMESGKQGTILLQKEASQSRTYLFEIGESGQLGCATYVKSLYGDKWRLYQFVKAEKENTIVRYIPDTQIVQYFIECTMDSLETASISVSQETKPVLTVKIIQIGIIGGAWAIGRAIGLSKERKKQNKY